MEESPNIDITKIIDFIEQQREKTNYTNVEKVVLFLGRTGTGKSTLTHFLVNPADIQCVGKEGQFIMTDTNGHISDPETTIISKTIYPEPLQYDDDLYFMDCPGFRDNRSFGMEIVSTIFTKKALKNAHGVKLIFVISYEEVKTGGDRNAFIELVENATDFINELNKFDNSIALFVTKVPNTTTLLANGTRELVPDSSMKQHVVDFLKTTLRTIKNPKNITKGKKHIYKEAEKFINILIEGGEDECSAPRIGIFRSPEQPGPISEMKSFQDARKALNSIIHNQLEFTDVCDDDFGYTISSGSKLCIMKAIEDSVRSTSTVISHYCTEALKSWRDFEIEEDDFQNLSEHFNAQFSRWKQTFDKLQSVEITSEALKYLIEHVELDPMYEANVSQIDSDSENDSESSDSKEESSEDDPYECNHSICSNSSRESDESTSNEDTDSDISSINENVKQLKNHAELIELMEMVSNEKYRISIAQWNNIFRKAFEEVSAASDWYGRVPILIIIFKYTTFNNGPDLVCKFMQKLDSWIDHEKPVPGNVFQGALSQIAKEFAVLQMGYDVSIPKMRRLYKLCRAAELDKTEESTGFWGGFKKFVGSVALAGTNAVLKLLDGKSPFQGDLFDEVRKICHMHK